MDFDHGVIEYKHRFSINRSLDDYQLTVLDNCICVGLQYKYYTMARDKLIAEVQIVRRVGPKSTECVKLDLHEYTFTVKHKGDMRICL